MSLNSLLAELRQYSGIAQKQEIQAVGSQLQGGFPLDYPNGDDTAAIRTAEGYDLYAIEGFLNQFVEQDPWFAGWCGLMVNISDIAAMGGRPVAVVNALWANQDDDKAAQILQGMRAASQVFHVPVVGGHSNLRSQDTQLAVSILGRAKKLLSSFAAESGQALVMAVDLRGAYRPPFLNWNAATTAPPERLRGDLALLPFIAESELAIAAKDISQAGILGTCVMLLESANVGADVQLEKIPKPGQVSWHDWLRSFPSFGYLLTTPKEKVADLVGCFQARGIDAAVIGEINSSQQLSVNANEAREIFWDVGQQPLTGLNKSMYLHNINTTLKDKEPFHA